MVILSFRSFVLMISFVILFSFPFLVVRYEIWCHGMRRSGMTWFDILPV